MFPVENKNFWNKITINGENWLEYSLAEAPKSQVPLNTIKKCAVNLSNSQDLNGIRFLCNILFSGPHFTFIRNMRSPTIKILEDKIYKSESPSWIEFPDLILTAATQWREKYDSPKIQDSEFKEVNFEVQKYFQENGKQKVKIFHGGGYENICSFLNGKHSGYGLESGGIGLQVHPVSPENKDEISKINELCVSYACRAIPQFDLPAIFSAKILLEHLVPAPNIYEAGLTSKNIKYLEEIEVTQVDVPLEALDPYAALYSFKHMTPISTYRSNYSDTL